MNVTTLASAEATTVSALPRSSHSRPSPCQTLRLHLGCSFKSWLLPAALPAQALRADDLHLEPQHSKVLPQSNPCLLTAHLYNHSAPFLSSPFVMCGPLTAMEQWTHPGWRNSECKSQTVAGLLSSTWQVRRVLFYFWFYHVVWSSALMPTSGKKTYPWGILWCLSGVWKSNLCSVCCKLSPQTEVHWKRLSLVGGSSTQNSLFTLFTEHCVPVSASCVACSLSNVSQISPQGIYMHV